MMILYYASLILGTSFFDFRNLYRYFGLLARQQKKTIKGTRKMNGWISKIARNKKGITTLTIKTQDIDQKLIDDICRQRTSNRIIFKVG